MSEREIKILFVLDGLWVGGTERSLADLLPRLEPAGILPMVACLRRVGDEGVEGEILDAGFDVHFLPSGGMLRQALALRRLIRDERPEIVHCALFRANQVGRLAAARTPTILVNSLVNTPYEPVRLEDPALRPVAHRLVRAIDGWTGRCLVDQFHAVSRAAARSAVERLRIPADRVTVIHRGRDPARLGEPSPGRKSAARERLGLSEDADVLVHLGRQDYQKGLSYLLRAFNRLAEERPGLVLLQAGREGSATAELEGLREGRAWAERVRFLGYRSDAPELLTAADLFVFPSLFEGLPGAVIEAMALGLPIVAADIPAVREVVETDGNAVLVPTKSSAALADALGSLLDDAGRRRTYGRRGRQLFEERFTLERCAAEMLSFYRGLCGDG